MIIDMKKTCDGSYVPSGSQTLSERELLTDLDGALRRLVRAFRLACAESQMVTRSREYRAAVGAVTALACELYPRDEGEGSRGCDGE